MFAATMALVVLSGPVGEIAQTTRDLHLDLRVIEAFEHGPVILDVSITNRGTKPLTLTRGAGQNDSRIALPAAWHAWSPPPGILLPTTALSPTLAPGQSLTERHRLHLDYLSMFPAGKYEVEVSWVLYGPAKAGEDLPVIAIPTKTCPVTISPATPANRYALACRLEAEFSTLPPDAVGADSDPLDLLCERLRNTPHKELIPLALQIMKRAEHDPKRWDLQRLMMEFLFRSDPPAAHRIFVDRLLTKPSASALQVFDFWRWAPDEFPDIARLYFERIYDQPRVEMAPDLDAYWFDPATWQHLWPGGEVRSLLLWANFSAPRILPADELKRLGKAKDFTVRAYTYSALGHRLGQAWCDEFLKETARYAQAKPDPKDADPEQSPLHVRLKHADPENPRDRKLLDVFAAGREENPLTKVARDVLARWEKEKGVLKS